MRTLKKRSSVKYSSSYNKYKHLLKGGRPSTKKRKKKTQRSRRPRNQKKRRRKIIPTQTRRVACAARNHSGQRPLSYTCYTPEELYRLKEKWNAVHGGNSDNVTVANCKAHPRVTGKTSKAIYRQLSKIMKREDLEENEWDRHPCLLKLYSESNFKKLHKNTIFAPASPESWKKNPYAWLSNIDIRNVISQHERIDPTFKFIGPSPIDYDERPYGDNSCVEDELCNFNLKKYVDKGVNKIGIVFNLDPHDKGGSHWIGCFIDNNKKFIFFFDSYGMKAPRRVRKFIDDVREQSVDIMANSDDKTTTGEKKRKYTYYANDVRHQYSNTECGIYCIHMIKQLLQDKNVYMFDNKITDAEMKALRSKYFILPK